MIVQKSDYEPAGIEVGMLRPLVSAEPRPGTLSLLSFRLGASRRFTDYDYVVPAYVEAAVPYWFTSLAAIVLFCVDVLRGERERFGLRA